MAHCSWRRLQERGSPHCNGEMRTCTDTCTWTTLCTSIEGLMVLIWWCYVWNRPCVLLVSSAFSYARLQDSGALTLDPTIGILIVRPMEERLRISCQNLAQSQASRRICSAHALGDHHLPSPRSLELPDIQTTPESKDFCRYP